MNESPLKILGLGTASITSMKTYGEANRILSKAYELGVTHFDTAPLYGQGYAEKIIGKFIKNKRDHITITTKFGLGLQKEKTIPLFLALPLNHIKKKWSNKRDDGVVKQPPDNLPLREIPLSFIKRNFELSLKTLNIDHIDYYFLHEGLPSFLKQDALTYLTKLKERGLVKHLGLATGSINLRSICPAEIIDWDVLQYEANFDNATKTLQDLFPEKLHFVHSCIKQIQSLVFPDEIDEKYRAGYTLAACTKKNHSHKTLFQTRKIDSLINNIYAFRKYYTCL
jgi:aryl-alcohol dehydrogenase-like predicted oxidoreductase